MANKKGGKNSSSSGFSDEKKARSWDGKQLGADFRLGAGTAPLGRWEMAGSQPVWRRV